MRVSRPVWLISKLDEREEKVDMLTSRSGRLISSLLLSTDQSCLVLTDSTDSQLVSGSSRELFPRRRLKNGNYFRGGERGDEGCYGWLFQSRFTEWEDARSSDRAGTTIQSAIRSVSHLSAPSLSSNRADEWSAGRR